MTTGTIEVPGRQNFHNCLTTMLSNSRRLTVGAHLFEDRLTAFATHVHAASSA